MRSAPLQVAGIRGTLQVDVATAAVLPLQTLVPPAGIAELAVNIPLLSALLGLDLYAQGLLLAPSPAFTATMHERVLP
jgi:hypothetical protein